MSTEQTEEPPKKVARIEQKAQQFIAKFSRDAEDISVPNWMIESLSFVTRNEMANSVLSTSSWLFHRLCKPKLHVDVKPHMVGPMKLDGERDESGHMQAISRYGGRLFPIPEIPPPDYIVGFKRISILFLDDRVLEFIKCIAPKLDVFKFVMKMKFEGWKWNVRNKHSRAIQCLLNSLAGRIGYFHFEGDSNFKIFNWHFRQFIEHCQCILISYVRAEFKKPEFNVFFKWLTNRQQMDMTKQKILHFAPNGGFGYFFKRIKKEFSNSTQPLNFLIYLSLGSALPQSDVVDLKNKNTGEVLISYLSEKFGGRLILRCPKGQEERWKKEGEEKMKMLYFHSDDVTKIELDIKHFGVANVEKSLNNSNKNFVYFSDVYR